MKAWMKQFCNSTDLAGAGLYKIRGAAVSRLLQLFLLLPFSGINIYEFKKTDLPVPGRDAFYRMLNHARYNWRKLIYHIAAKLIAEFQPLTNANNPRVMIVDDSPYMRNRSKKVEYLGRQHDHSDGSYYRGFRLLSTGWSDGHSFVPCELELLTNQDPDKRLGPDPVLDRRSHGGQRSVQATRKATDLAEEMIIRGTKNAGHVDYVVFDSWFAHPGLMHRVGKHAPVVCQVKNGPIIQYRHNKRIYHLQGLYEKVCRMSRRDKKDAIIGSIVVQMLSGPDVRVVFLRDKNRSGKWMALACTDTTRKPEKICQIYARRWDIEVFYKMVKQHLGLYDMEPRSYVSMVAYTSIVFMRYMMFTYYQRLQIDEMTLPGMFRQCAKELQSATVEYCLLLLQWEFLASICKNPMQPVISFLNSFSNRIQDFSNMIRVSLLINNQLTINCDS